MNWKRNTPYLSIWFVLSIKSVINATVYLLYASVEIISKHGMIMSLIIIFLYKINMNYYNIFS